MTKKDNQWAELIDKLGLDLSRPVNTITAEQIHVNLRGVEPRLLASMDTEDSLAPVLRSHGVFVLPTSRAEYAVVRGEGYHELEPTGEPILYRAKLPIDLASLSYGNGEGRFVLHAYHIGLLGEFSGVKPLYQTIVGKGGTLPFKYRVNGAAELEARGAGMEIDSGFEGPDSLLLFEAKVGLRRTFLIRQLYFPYRSYRTFLDRRHRKKSVRAFFFVAQFGTPVYSLWEYDWSDPEDYEAIRLVKSASFRIVEDRAPEDWLTEISPDPTLDIVPQADDLSKIVDLPLLVRDGVDTAKAWSERYGITVRQGSYYRQAAEALGLVRLEGDEFVLTREGKTYVQLNQAQRDERIAELLLKNPLLNSVFHLARERGPDGVGDSDVARLIEEMSHLRGTTPARRAKSVRSYFRWLAGATGAIVVERQRIYSRSGWTDRTGR